ncbi:MAG: sugar ABC transporter permease [Clostridia bacterium]|nr:sugar ABC transporter permease [Clostridia bacterium]
MSIYKARALRRRSGLERKIALAGFRMVLPSMLVISVFVIWPIIRSLIMSFTNWNILRNTHSYVGMENYVKMFGDERFLNALKNTVEYTLWYVPLLMFFSLLFAAAFHMRFSGSGFYKSLLFVPAVTSMAIVAIIFRYILDGDIGLVSLWLRKIGISVPDFLRNERTAMGAVIFTSLWRWIGFNTVILLAGMSAIPESLFEAAEIDGAGNLRRFFSITLPLLAPSVSFTLITNIISSFQVYDQVYVMTKGGPMFRTEVLVYYIYYNGFNVYKMGYASAMAFFLFLIILMFTLFQLKGFQNAESNLEA